MNKKLLFVIAGAFGALLTLAGVGALVIYKNFCEIANEEEKEIGFPKFIENKTKKVLEKVQNCSKETIEKAKDMLGEVLDGIGEATIPDDMSANWDNSRKTRAGGVPISEMP
jgi:hypothetical protein